MDLLQTIYSNNKLVLEAVERVEPVLRRLAGKTAEKLRAGGRIICIGGASSVPQAYRCQDIFFALDAQADMSAFQQKVAFGRNDVFLVVECDADDAMAAQMRAWRRWGMFTACLSCRSASSLATASEIAVILSFETVSENRPLKERCALQVALDALLTLSFAEYGAAMGGGAKQSSGDDALEKAAASLIREIPALDREGAIELIKRYGSVKKAVKAYNADV